MKNVLMLTFMLITVFIVNYSMAGENITGTWQGKLAPAPDSELKIQFIITQNEDGSYAAVLTSPDQGAIRDVKAASVTFDSEILKIDVTELSGSYEGVLKDGKFEGNWKQEGTSMPLNLSKNPVLTMADMEKLTGEWYGPLGNPDGDFIMVFKFEIKEGGEFKAFVNAPAQGDKWGPVSDVELVDGSLTLQISYAGAEYKGEITGNEIVGAWTQGEAHVPLNLKKGEYKPEVTLNLSRTDKEKLSGRWYGPLNPSTGDFIPTFRFEIKESGEFYAFLDVPVQGLTGMLFTDVELVDGTLTLRLPATQAEYKGKITGDEIKGEWIQGGNPESLNLKKGENKPEVALSLSKEIKDKLSGEWHGELSMPDGGLMNVSFKFETTQKDDFVGFYVMPAQNEKGIPIKEADYTNNKLILKFANVEFKGTLEGDVLTGEMAQDGVDNIPLIMKKGK